MEEIRLMQERRNLVLIVVYNRKVFHSLGDLMELSRLLEKKGIEFTAQDCKCRIKVGEDIVVDFIGGEADKMAGMRPNYFVLGYNSGWYAHKILVQAVSKTGGKELKNVYEVAKVIEEKVKNEVKS